MREAGVILRAENAEGFNRQLDRAEKAISDFGASAGRGAGGVDRLSVATVALGTALGNLAGQAINAAANALTNFASSGWNYARTLENAEAQLLAFTGSQEEAARVLEMVERRAAATPFAFDEMATSAASLAATARGTGEDLETLIGLAERLGASNPVEGLEGAAFALREAFAGDFTSLRERFNIGKEDIERLKEMGVTADNLSLVLGELGISTDLVSNMANTFDGRMSTLMDTFTRAAGIFAQPIFDAIGEGIFNLQGTLDQNMPEIESRLAESGQFVADAITSFREGWEGNWVDSDIIQPAHRVAGVLGTTVREAVDKITLAWGTWNELVQKGKDIWNDPWVQDKIITPLGELGSQIAEDLMTDLGNLGREWESLNLAGEAWNSLLNAGQELVNTISGYFATLGINVGGAAGAFDKLNPEMAESKSVGELLATVFGWVEYAISAASIAINNATRDLKTMIGMINNAIAAWNNLMAVLPGNIQGASDAAAAAVQNAADQTFGAPPPKGTGSTSKVMAPIPPGRAPGRSSVVVNNQFSIVVPPTATPAQAGAIVSDGINQALRSRGMG